MQQDITNTQNENDRPTQTEVIEQSQDKNDSVQLSTRYGQYDFAKRHLRGTRRPEVFPITSEYPENRAKLAGTLMARDYKGIGNQEMTVVPYADGRKGRSAIHAHRVPEIGNETTSIRRLTPTECERLQGFPDGWTEGVSDTQRYKCLGNAVTVNVIQAIMEKLLL